MQISVSDLVDTWDELAKGECRDVKTNSYGVHKVRNYIKSINCLPLEWEDVVSTIHEYHHIVSMMGGDLECVKSAKETRYASEVRIGQCFIYAINEYFRLLFSGKRPNFYLGFAANEEGIPTRSWWVHAFLVVDGDIVEPTPMIRDHYYGKRLMHLDVCRLMAWILSDGDDTDEVISENMSKSQNMRAIHDAMYGLVHDWTLLHTYGLVNDVLSDKLSMFNRHYAKAMLNGDLGTVLKHQVRSDMLESKQPTLVVIDSFGGYPHGQSEILEASTLFLRSHMLYSRPDFDFVGLKDSFDRAYRKHIWPIHDKQQEFVSPIHKRGRNRIMYKDKSRDKIPGDLIKKLVGRAVRK